VWLKEKELEMDTRIATRNSIKIFNNCGYHNAINISMILSIFSVFLLWERANCRYLIYSR